MAQILRDDHLDGILKSTPKKLICVLFGNPGFAPCTKARQLWDKLVPKYPTCVFIYAECDKCQTDARRQEIKEIPTFIFYKNQSIINRIVGINEKEIIQCIESNRTAGAFEGSSHKVGWLPPENEMPIQKPPPKPSQTLSEQKPQSQPQPKNSIAEVRRQLLDFGFPLSVIDKAIQATNFGSVDDCLEYISSEQEKEEEGQSKSPETPPTPNSPEMVKSENPPTTANQPNASNSGPKRMLSPAAKAMKEQLLDFGYQEEEIDKAIGIVGPDSIDKLIDCIARLQSGEDSSTIAQQQQQQLQKQKLSQEELNKRADELKQRAHQKEIEKQKAAPKLAAQKELERRKDVLMQVELKRQQDERKRQLDMEVAAKQKIQDKIERERVKKMIAQQRGQNVENQSQQKQQQNPAPRKAPNECTLKVVIPGDKDLILKFSPDAKFEEVDQKVKSERPNVVGNITYRCSYPPKLLTNADFDKSVTDLGLMPRSMLTVV